jgi:hypothetical protein
MDMDTISIFLMAKLNKFFNFYRGIDTTTKFFQEYDLNLKKNQKVLDVGCGIGGGDFFIAEVSLIFIEIYQRLLLRIFFG